MSVPMHILSRADQPDSQVTILQGIRDSVIATDLKGQILYWNEGAQSIFGYSAEEMLGQPAVKLHPEQGPQQLAATLQKVSQGEACNEEWRGRRKDGSTVWVDLTMTAMRNVEGDVIGFINVAKDITERKRVAEELQDSLQKLKNAYEQAKVYARELNGEIIERRQAQEALRHRAVQLEALRQVGLELTAELDINALLHSIVSRAIEMLRGVAGGFYLYRPEQDILEWAVAIGSNLAPTGAILRRGEGFAGKVWENGQPLIVDDYPQWSEKVAISSEFPYPNVVGVPIRWGKEFLGVLDIFAEASRTFLPADAELLTLFATQAAIAIHNARLFEAERSACEQLSNLASYLQAAREEERTRIAREIHDEFGQALTTLKMDLSWIAKRLSQSETALHQKTASMSQLIDATVQMVHRVATELRPGILDDLGLAAAIEWQTQEFAKRTGLDYELDLSPKDLVLDRELTTAIFRVFQETLTNIARHAEATRVSVTLKDEPDEWVLTVHDDGVGLTRKQVDSFKSLGLVGMRERVHPWGGAITFYGVPNQGTTVTLRMPKPKA